MSNRGGSVGTLLLLLLLLRLIVEGVRRNVVVGMEGIAGVVRDLDDVDLVDVDVDPNSSFCILRANSSSFLIFSSRFIRINAFVRSSASLHFLAIPSQNSVALLISISESLRIDVLTLTVSLQNNSKSD